MTAVSEFYKTVFPNTDKNERADDMGGSMASGMRIIFKKKLIIIPILKK